MAELTIVLVSYNTAKLTVAAVESVYDQTDMSSKDLIVFDNASTDNSMDQLKFNFPDLHLINSDINYGFALANNIAAKESKAEYILLLNPDTVVLDGAIDKLLAFAKDNPEAGIWGGRTLYGDRTLNPLSCFGRMTLWNQFCRASGLAAIFKKTDFFNSEEFGGWQRDSVREVDIVSGCFLLIKRSLWEQLQGFDEKFFMYAEDADLCLRARQLGANPMITPEATIIHYGGASEGVRADKMVRLLTAKTELIQSYWPRWKQPLGKLMLGLWVLTRIIALSIVKPGSKNLLSWKEVWKRRKIWFKGYAGSYSKPAGVSSNV
ncbi:glycosyltransferase family 2 protein [Neptuniibacter caesariensis]|uniref:Glycosyl transferase, group 2 family protein n=1 Tax=Neptuniibacter caesariensis TaxID=207954 RepID=A0A7U8C1R8_NEPCE|nr:glycosyltransferase family 2 protein [Neptuniibacter caesariensis]EAR59927.1 glycosyl transferase, group 2 family protein [Oceanospirillum sp. MED92] [Neptuniibacter caesariensis]